MEGQQDGSFRDEQKNQCHETDAEPDAWQGRQHESVYDPPRADYGGEQHVRNLQHVSKPLADMQGHYLQSNDLENKLCSSCDQKVDSPGLQHPHQTMRFPIIRRLIRF